MVGWSLWSPCASWPARAEDRYTRPWNASTKDPILVIGTRFDPVTPFANARRAARRLGNAVLLTHQGYGHTSASDPSACVIRAIGRYVTKLTTPRRGAICRSAFRSTPTSANHSRLPLEDRTVNHQWAHRGGRYLWPIVLTLIACVVISAPGRVAAAASAPLAGAAEKGVAWSDCGEALECARVRVPLDWDRPRGRKIKLSVIRHLASRPDERIGSLFINPGGPGASIASVREGGKALDALAQGRFDIVTWDIRGSGESAGVSCFKSERRRARFWDRQSIPTTTPSSRRYLPKTAAFAKRCGALNGALLAHISTTDTVRDLDYLRGLVGDRKLTFYGASAGTFLGQTYANMFPRRVRAIVLDGVVDPVAWTAGTEPQIANLRGDTDRVFEKFQLLCESAGPADCALAGHGPVARRVSRLLARLKRRRIAAPSATPPGRLAYGEALTAITSGLDAPAGWPQLAKDLDAAADGDGSSLATRAREELADLYSVEAEQTRAIVCADSPARQGPRAWPRVVDRLTDVSRISGPLYAWWEWAACASWPVRGADRYKGPWDATTNNPILVLGPRFDPSTPFGNARRVARRLGNAVLLAQDGYGHLSSADPSACVRDVVRRYLIDLVTPPRGTVCPSDRLPFDPDFGEPIPRRSDQ